MTIKGNTTLITIEDNKDLVVHVHILYAYILLVCIIEPDVCVFISILFINNFNKIILI